MASLIVPRLDSSTSTIKIGAPVSLMTASTPARSRVAYAAAHVVAKPDASGGARDGTSIDWDATMALRHRLWGLGLGVAESMDTSQRGMGLSWRDAMELGSRTLREAKASGGKVVVGIGTDALPPGAGGLDRIREAYVAQMGTVEAEGGQSVMMASRQLAASVFHPADYVAFYSSVLEQAETPVILHWLGDVFDPELAGYWGAKVPADAVDTIVELIEHNSDQVAGIKVSVLDAKVEVALRDRLPDGVHTFTGDDFHYVDLIAGDESGHSDALLGAFAAVAPYASAALRRLDEGDESGFRDILGPTETLSRLIFAAPTQYYKVGVAWLSYLDGLQETFLMLDRFESNRRVEHLGELVVEANKLGYFRDPDLAAARAAEVFARHGIR